MFEDCFQILLLQKCDELPCFLQRSPLTSNSQVASVSSSPCSRPKHDLSEKKGLLSVSEKISCDRKDVSEYNSRLQLILNSSEPFPYLAEMELCSKIPAMLKMDPTLPLSLRHGQAPTLILVVD